MPNSHRQTQTFNRHIPIEVVEVIIDHLHNDKKSLNVCTLVARRWLPTSRYHLISSVRVDQKNYRGLLELLSAPYARLAVSVLELKLVRFNEDDNAWLNYALPTFAKHFSSITSLSLAGIKWRQLNPRSVDCIKTAFRKTTKLLLLDCFFVSFSQIIELISSFEVLEDLKCVVCKCDSQGRAPSPQLKMASRLKTFMFDDGHPMLLAWLADQKPIRLQELFVEGISLPRLHSVNALVVHAGSALKRMRFHFEDDYMQHRGAQPPLDLSQNTSLESLELSIAFPNPFQFFMGLPSGRNISFLVPLLSSISSPPFTAITFRILVGSPDDLIDIKWRDLDKIFVEKPNLKKILFTLTNMMPNVVPEDFMEEAEMIIYPGLHNTAKRGLLDVRYAPVPRQRRQ